MEKEQKKRFWQIVVSIAVILFSILMIIAILQNERSLVEDYSKFTSGELSFYKLITLDFPEVSNPIGPFGVIFGYLFLTLFGRLMAFSILLVLVILATLKGIIKYKNSIFIQTVSFLSFAFFSQMLIFSFEKNLPHYFSGILPANIFIFMQKIFGNTGTIIISLIIFLSSFLALINPNNLFKFFKWIFSLFKKDYQQEEKQKKNKKKKEKKRKKKEPKITDHRGDITDEDNPLEIEYKPKIKPRKLSQNKEDLPLPDELREFVLPSINEFLKSKPPSKKDREKIAEHIKKISKILENKLKEFGVEAEVINVNIGPVITQYEIKPAPGVKVSKFQSLADDLSLAIKATSIRVQAPIPGRGLVGIEIPNIAMDTIYLKDILMNCSIDSQVKDRV